MTQKEFISSQLLSGQDRTTVISNTLLTFNLSDREAVSNYVGVILHTLRKQGLVAPLIKSDRPSRHSLIKKGLYKNKSNKHILNQLRKIYPEISDKIHRQRLAEYSWFYRKGLL